MGTPHGLLFREEVTVSQTTPIRLGLWPPPAQQAVPPDGPSRPVQGEAVRAADREAQRLLDTYGNSILRLACSYLHSLPDAEEILQDTLLRCLQSAPAFESPEHEKAWLLHVAANLSKNRIDYNRLRAAQELTDLIPAAEREDLSFVWEAVAALPEHYRAAIHLFYYEGLSTAQIAHILGRSETAVRSALHRGREKLREILREDYDFEIH